MSGHRTHEGMSQLAQHFSHVLPPLRGEARVHVLKPMVCALVPSKAKPGTL